jgi:hypothetical protein
MHKKRIMNVPVLWTVREEITEGINHIPVGMNSINCS